MSTSPERPTGGRPGSRGPVLAMGVLIVVFVAGHLPFLVSAPTDVDEANFVLGVRQFDVTAHQPHPPGYPVFVALGKLARPVVARLALPPLELGGAAAVESRALAFWAALLGGFALMPLFVFFRRLEGREDVALAATAATAAMPLYWFTAARPLSDVPGLAAVVLVDALLLESWRRARAAGPDTRGGVDPSSDRAMLGAAFIAGIAAGLRSQTFWLMAPFFLFVLAWRRDRVAGLALRSAGLWLAGVTLWAVPMILVTGGGARAYVEALRWQASDDFAGVEMLVSTPTARSAAVALWNTFGRPWATVDFARGALGLSAIGLAALLWRGRPALGLLAIAFAPYAAFHLLFHETATTRYALPLVPPVTYLALRGLRIISRRFYPIAAALVVASLPVLTLPSFVRYTRSPSPAFAALDAVARLQQTPAYGRSAVASHHTVARTLQVSGLRAPVMLPAPLRREWLGLGDYWRSGGREPVLFLRDPRRGDLDLIDSRSRAPVGHYRWRFPRERFLGGIRPDLVDLVAIASPPGWFCGEGWHLTPEALGVSKRRGVGDATAFIRRRPDAAMLVLGGTQVEHSDRGPDVDVEATLDGRPVARWTLSAGHRTFFDRINLPIGSLEGRGAFAELVVRYAATGNAGAPDVHLLQFDVQSASDRFFVPGPGWHEREYELTRDRSWRWTSERATTFVNAADRDFTLRIAGESPLKYFDSAPLVTLRAGDTLLARFTPSTDFTEEIVVPARVLDAAAGILVLETTRTFVPAEISGSADRRRLGLRIFELSLH